MGLTNYDARTEKVNPTGTRIITSKSDDGSYTTRVYIDKDGECVKGSVYRGPLDGKHSHYDKEKGDIRGDVIRSDVFR